MTPSCRHVTRRDVADSAGLGATADRYGQSGRIRDGLDGSRSWWLPGSGEGNAEVWMSGIVEASERFDHVPTGTSS
jgi:hypothetical protein